MTNSFPAVVVMLFFASRLPDIGKDAMKGWLCYIAEYP